MLRLETEAKLFIQKLIRQKIIDLVWSSMLDFENDKNPANEKAERIRCWKNYAVSSVTLNAAIWNTSVALQKIGLKPEDSIHIACAIDGKAEYFVTTDKRILNKPITGIQVINPIYFVDILANEKE